MHRVATILAAGILAAITLLFVLGWVHSPVVAERVAFDRRVGQIDVPNWQFDDNQDPEFGAWQHAIAAQPRLWEPLLRPEAKGAPPPDLANILAGVVPTRNEIGAGDSRKVQIQVEGVKDWYTKGQQIKGCTIKEITDATVLFSVAQGAQEFGIALPRR